MTNFLRIWGMVNIKWGCRRANCSLAIERTWNRTVENRNVPGKGCCHKWMLKNYKFRPRWEWTSEAAGRRVERGEDGKGLTEKEVNDKRAVLSLGRLLVGSGARCPSTWHFHRHSLANPQPLGVMSSITLWLALKLEATVSNGKFTQ